MTEWNYPKINEPDNLFKTTDEMLSEWELEYKRCNEANALLIESLHKTREELIEKASAIWGSHSNQVKYLKKQRIFSPSRLEFSDMKRKVEKAKKDHDQETRDLENSNAHDRLVEKAIVWLTQHNYVLGADFTIHGALSMANNIAFEEEQEKRINEIKSSGNLIDFYGGDDCEEDCKGWDGESNRCQCGNYRVGWDNSENDDFFLDPYIYGERN